MTTFWKQPPRYAPVEPKPAPRPGWLYSQPADATGLKPLPGIQWADHSMRLSLHESAHAVAAYLFDREVGDIKVSTMRGRGR